jgi:hypothetical protein
MYYLANPENSKQVVRGNMYYSGVDGVTYYVLGLMYYLANPENGKQVVRGGTCCSTNEIEKCSCVGVDVLPGQPGERQESGALFLAAHVATRFSLGVVHVRVIVPPGQPGKRQESGGKG